MRRGPAALLIAAVCSACTSPAPTPSELTPRQIERATGAAAGIDPMRLRAHVEAIVATRTEEPAVSYPWNHSALPYTTRVRAADYIMRQLTELGYAPVAEAAMIGQADITNIYVDVLGAQRPDEQVLLTAHYDSFFAAGADDNASGVAVLLEAARVLRESRPARTIRIVAFDREEDQAIGSTRYVDEHGGDDVRVVVNLDGVAFASHEPNSQQAPTGLTFRSVADFLAVIGNGPAQGYVSQFMRLRPIVPQTVDAIGLIGPGDVQYPGISDLGRSDHNSFWRHGVAALFVTDTNLFRNPNYHSRDDLPDTLDYDFFARSARLIVASVAAFAEGE